jgi:steroid delta-isomerase-like uncharacterized protein
MGQARDAAARFYELFAEEDIDGAAEIFDPDCTHVMPGGEQGMDQWKAFNAAFRRALTDAHMDVQNVVESDDAVAVEARFKGTFDEPLALSSGEIPPSGKPIDVRFADFFKLSDGKVVEHRVYWDQAELLTQLGVSPDKAD